MHKTKFLTLLIITITVLFSCQNRPSEKTNEGENNLKKQIFDFGEMVADTIIYPVDVINLDSTDDWKTTRLKNLRHDKLTDILFNALYSEKIKATDYYSGEEIPVAQIKEMEQSGELDRDKIAQVQFEESWFFDSDNGRMTKQVQSIMLAWPVYTNQGEFFGYKAGFVIELNP